MKDLKSEKPVKQDNCSNLNKMEINTMKSCFMKVHPDRIASRSVSQTKKMIKKTQKKLQKNLKII